MHPSRSHVAASIPLAGRIRPHRSLLPSGLVLLALWLGSAPLAGYETPSDTCGADAFASGVVPSSNVADTVSVEALGAANPLVPRRAFLLGLEGSSTLSRGIHGPDGVEPVGGAFLRPSLGPGLLPEFAVAEARFRELARAPSDWQLSLGRVRGHMSAAEQHLPIQVAYGVLDRLTLGVTVPFVRRRSNSSLRLSGEGATVGESPWTANRGGVDEFLAGARSALMELESRLGELCAPGGSSNGDAENGPSCQDGQRLLGDARRFMLDLEAAYEEELVFPLRGTSGGDALSGRWTTFREGFSAWDVDGPEGIPLATAPFPDAQFYQRFVDPVWGEDTGEAFPRAVSGEDMLLGDVEAHAVVGLLDRPIAGNRVRLRSSAVVSVRFPTGEPDSLQLVAPLDPSRGTGGVGGKLVTDLISDRRYGLLTVVEAWTFQEEETVVLAPDPNRVFGTLGVDRLPVRWTPGTVVRVAVKPRVHITPGLSLGLGYRYFRRGAATYERAEPGNATPENGSAAGSGTWVRPVALPEQGGATLHHLRGEFRYHGFDAPIAPVLPFPIEVYMAYGGTMGGSGDSPLSQRRMEAGIRVLRGAGR